MLEPHAASPPGGFTGFVGTFAGAQLSRRTGADAAALGFLPFVTAPACAAVSAVAALGCAVAGADAAGTVRACGAVNAGLLVLVAICVAGM